MLSLLFILLANKIIQKITYVNSLFSQEKKSILSRKGETALSALCLNLIFISPFSFAALTDTVHTTNPIMVYVTECCVDGEYPSKASAFSAIKAVYDLDDQIPGLHITRTATNLHPWKPDYYPSYNGIPSYFVSDTTICNNDVCSTQIDGGPTVVLRVSCPPDVVVMGASQYTWQLTLMNNDPLARIYSCKRTIPLIPQSNQCGISNPVLPATGEKLQIENDYRSADGLLDFTRTYLSTFGTTTSINTSSLIDNTSTNILLQGCFPTSYIENTSAHTRKNVCLRYLPSGEQNYVVRLANGLELKFFGTPDATTASADVTDKLVRITNAQGNFEWQLTHADNSKEFFDAAGKLIRKITPQNRTLTYAYSDATTPTSIASRSDLMISVTDDRGSALNFSYNSSDQLVTMLDPKGGAYTYTYDSFNNFTSVTYPDLSAKQYSYGEAANINGGVVCPGTQSSDFGRLLTGITDEKGVRFADFKYQCDHKTASSEHAGGVEKTSFTYPSSTTTTYIDPLNASFTRTYTNILNALALTSISQPSGSGCNASNKTTAYDANRNISQTDDFNGNRSCFVYDARNLNIAEVRGLNSSAVCATVVTANTTLPIGAKKISTEWHPTWRKQTRIAEPKKITTNIYNGQPDPFTGGTAYCAPSTVTAPLLCKKVEQATTDTNGSLGFTATLDNAITQREWRYTYNNIGKILTAVTPHDILKNVVGTTNIYYSTTTANYHIGDLQSTTNALNQTTQYLNYDANGRPLEILRADGSHRWFTYDLRGRLKTSKLDNDTTTYGYDLAGNLTSVTSPTNSVITYGYDAAHRLTSITNSAGDRIEYTLDNAGNTTALIMRDNSGTLKYQQQKIYDALSRVKQIVDTKNNTTTYLYDANGNSTGVQDAKLQSTSNTYDALDQMKLTTDALNGQTNYSYDAAGRVTQVTDPKNHSTVYNYNAFGDLTSQISPDTGTTSFTYDAAGNRTSATDARGVVVNYAYDALQRLTAVTYPASTTENISFTYDSTANGSYGIGRLASVSTAAARNDYEYNHLGLITKKYSLVGATLSTTQYSYDAAGNLTGMIYPTGRSVTYVRDTSGRIQSISTQANLNATSQTVLSGMTYLPFGPASSYNYGNGLSHTLSYDTDYRLNSIQVGGVLLRNYGFDAVDNITSIGDGLVSTKNQTFNYDALNRITYAKGKYGTLNYTYDSVGNRLTEKLGTATSTYNYETTSNHLLGITRASGNRSFTYDLAGNMATGTSDANKAQTYNYNNANRLASVTVASAAVGTYTYNALGQRVSKVATSSVNELYHYDEAGQLIAVTDSTGLIKREYIYNGNSLAGFNNVVTTSAAVPAITNFANQATITGSAAIATTQTGYTSPTGYINFTGEGQASWPVTINTAATYTTAVSYAMTGANRAVDVYVDNVKKTSITFTATTNLNTWATKSVSLALTTGAHTIAIKTKGTSAPNIDTLKLSTTTKVVTSTPSFYYVHNDHHNAPQVVTNQSGQVVWMMDYQPFGKTTAGQTNSIEIYSRFPGQFYDSETGLYQNYFRDYDPSIGRYIESDPIGLGGGINTYAYVGGNPMRSIDPSGLAPGYEPSTVTWCRANPIGCAEIMEQTVSHVTPTEPVIPAEPAEKAKPEPCPPKEPEEDDGCTKASDWTLSTLGIDPHPFKKDIVQNQGGKYDICICKKGEIKLKKVGQCGKPGPSIPTYY